MWRLRGFPELVSVGAIGGDLATESPKVGGIDLPVFNPNDPVASSLIPNEPTHLELTGFGHGLEVMSGQREEGVRHNIFATSLIN